VRALASSIFIDLCLGCECVGSFDEPECSFCTIVYIAHMLTPVSSDRVTPAELVVNSYEECMHDFQKEDDPVTKQDQLKTLVCGKDKPTQDSAQILAPDFST
jgi:hypothetical protein